VVAGLAALLYAIPREGLYMAVAGTVTGVLVGTVLALLAFRRGALRVDGGGGSATSPRLEVRWTSRSTRGGATYRSAWMAFVIVLATVLLYVWLSKDPAAAPLGAGFLMGSTGGTAWSALHRRAEAR